jgi:hypothetical protein
MKNELRTTSLGGIMAKFEGFLTVVKLNGAPDYGALFGPFDYAGAVKLIRFQDKNELKDFLTGTVGVTPTSADKTIGVVDAEGSEVLAPIKLDEEVIRKLGWPLPNRRNR